jgi:hypothetical protein
VPSWNNPLGKGQVLVQSFSGPIRGQVEQSNVVRWGRVKKYLLRASRQFAGDRSLYWASLSRIRVSTVARDMWGDVVEQGQAESPGSDGASPYLSPRSLVPLSAILGNLRRMGFISVRWGQVNFWAVPMCLGPYKAGHNAKRTAPLL